ncbi:MAG TPA: vWA domain-containing protein, partial [Pirellulales bacterium]
MFDYTITFLRPSYLLLLLLAPFMWSWSYRSLSGLGGRRRIVALLLRTAVLFLLVAALAEVQIVRISERLTTIFVLDQSRSIPEAARREMTKYVNLATNEQRKGDDRAGVIVFGKTAAIETPPFDDLVRLGDSLDAMRDVDPRHTDMAAAIKLAIAAFPEDAAKRIVLIGDGNENVGSALEAARSATEAGVGIDVLPIKYEYSGEILVESLSLPPDVRKDQPFDLRVVVNNTAQATEQSDGRVAGRLVVSATVDGATRVLNADPDKPFDEGGQKLVI